MDKPTLRNGAFLALLHLIVTLGLLVYVFSGGMARLDNGVPARTMEEVASWIVEVLLQPIGTLWPVLARMGIPGFLEWPLFLLNSLFWGYGALFITRVGRRWLGRAGRNGKN